MIAAAKSCGISTHRSTKRIASMAAGIEKHMKLHLIISSDDDRLLSDPGRPIVTRFWKLTLVRKVDPRSGEDTFQLVFENPGVRVDLSVNLKLMGLVYDKGLVVARCGGA
jgi:hypothetical protein